MSAHGKVQDTSPNHTLTYRPDIDGLRAVSILIVVLFHAGFGFKGGYVGVDVFFVISGYLITAMLLREMKRGRICLVDFWERRIRRIFPALFVTVASTLAAGCLLMLPESLLELAKSSIAQSLMGANMHFWATSGYFASASEENPLLHMWSLAVEEQFYLLLPLILLLIAKVSSLQHGQRRTTIITFLSLFFLSLGAGIYTTFTSPDFAFFWLPPRAWELLLGSLLAARPPHWHILPSSWRGAVGWLGLTAILVASLAFESDTPFPGFAVLLPTLGAALFLLSNETGLNGAGRLLSTRPAMFLGRISYSLYLWHWPLLAYAAYLTVDHNQPATWPLRIGLVVASVILAWLSWRWVETPVRQRRLLGTRRSVFAFAAISTDIMLLGAWMLVHHAGWPQRIPAQTHAYLAGQKNHPAYDSVPYDTFRDHLGPDFPRLGIADSSAASPHVLVWGDSHAGRILPVIHDLCVQNHVTGLGAFYSSTSPLLNYYRQGKHSLNERAPAWAEQIVSIIREKRIPHTVLAAYWQKAPGKDKKRFSEALLKTVRELRKTGTTVWILLDVPTQSFDPDKALALYSLHPALYTPPADKATTEQEHADQNRVMLDLIPALKEAGAHILDPLPYFSKDQRTLIEAEGKALYTDPHHITASAAARLMPLFAPIFEQR